jgi:RimJ/RimL family protein N-acetyltransferase
MAPTMKTRSLILRPLELSDAPRMAAFMREPEIARMSSSMPSIQPVIGAEGFILIMQARAPLKREHLFAVELAGEGFIGLANAHLGKGSIEIGYWIAKPYWGRGFGSEVAVAIAGFADALNAGPVIAYHFIDNPISGRVLQKAGFDYTGEVHDLYSLSRDATVPSRLMVHQTGAKLAA